MRSIYYSMALYLVSVSALQGHSSKPDPVKVPWYHRIFKRRRSHVQPRVPSVRAKPLVKSAQKR